MANADNRLDFYPTRAFFRQPQAVAFRLRSPAPFRDGSRARLRIYHLDKLIHTADLALPVGENQTNLPAGWDVLPEDIQLPAGFIAECQIFPSSGNPKTLYTAFDLAASWTRLPRYGYLCDFHPDRQDSENAIEELLKFHINGLQFYDWQYRHEQLLPRQPLYQDVLGRSLSLPVVKELMDAAHQRGMACMPYLAIYGASLAYWRKHPDSTLYDAGGRPELFHDFLGLMNPAPQSAWSDHLAGECQRVLDNLPFDGLHIDQYGQPHKAFNYNGQAVDLPAAFVAFIERVKNAHADKSVVFNAVDNWPIEALCRSKQDFMYIEIWPPSVLYEDLLNTIRNAQHLSGYKPVVLALYIPAAWSANARLSSALIFAAGATRIELGENARYLSDPYFPKHQALSPALYKSLRRYYDFIAAFREWLKPTQDHTEIQVRSPDGVMAFSNHVTGKLAIQLVNFSGLEKPRWNKRHHAPRILRDAQLSFTMAEQPKRVLAASADEHSPRPKLVPFTYANGRCSLRLPRLKYWSTIFIETE